MRNRGFTLTEMLVVVTIVGIIAAATTASLATSDEVQLDAAASEVVTLIRFARSEAIRTGKSYGVATDVGNQRIRPYIRSGFFGLPSYTVRNPASKNLYDLRFNSAPGISDVVLADVNFNFHTIGQQSFLGFNPDGVPKYESSSNVYLLDSATIRLNLGEAERIINISPTTGRVVIQ